MFFKDASIYFQRLLFFQVLSEFSLPTSISLKLNPLNQPQQQTQLVKIIIWLLKNHLLLQLHTYVQYMPSVHGRIIKVCITQMILYNFLTDMYLIIMSLNDYDVLVSDKLFNVLSRKYFKFNNAKVINFFLHFIQFNFLILRMQSRQIHLVHPELSKMKIVSSRKIIVGV